MSDSAKPVDPPAPATEEKKDEKAARTTAEADITKYKARPLVARST
jgi:hypothetical protein